MNYVYRVNYRDEENNTVLDDDVQSQCDLNNTDNNVLLLLLSIY
jgi:hypothetical protein